MTGRPRTSPIMMPMLDAVSGRSYGQSNQTAGALGGRRNKEEWFVGDSVSAPNHKIVKTAGGVWRLVGASARVRIAPTIGSLVIDILAQVPGAGSPVSIFSTLPTIPPGETEAVEGVINTGSKLLPVGTLVSMSVAGSVEVLVATGVDVSTREQSQLSIPGDWTTPVSMTGITSSDPRIVPITDQLMFAINSNGDIKAFGWGVGARSKDGGATWSATPDPGSIGAGGGGIMDITQDAGGRLWCLAHDGHSTWTRTKVFWSDDDGDTWTLSLTKGNASSDYYRTWKIIPHPSDQDIIAVIGQRGTIGVTGVLYYTDDRGSSWPETLSNDIRPGDLASSTRYDMDAIMLANGRVVVCGNFEVGTPFHWRVRYTDDKGSVWNTPWSADDSNARVTGLFANPAGSRLAFFYLVDRTASPRDHRLMLSTDGGDSFGQVSLAEEAQDFIGADFDYVGRFVASPERDAIYLATNTTKDVVKLSPVSGAGVWTDLTGMYPHASQGEENLGILSAGAAVGAYDLTAELHYRVRAAAQ